MTGAPAGTGAAPPRTRAGSARVVLALVCACQFMVILDVSIVNVVLPSVERDLGFSATGLTWVVNGYLLAFAGLMLLGGSAADLFGHRRMLVTGLAAFSAGSLAAGLATTPEVLVGARVTQGLGAAMLAPATLAVINTRFTAPAERARAFGAWSASGGVGGMAGALAGGALTTGLSWRWVFLVNVPIGAVLAGTALASPAARGAARREPLDVAGAVTGTAGLTALVLGVMESAGHDPMSARVAGPVGAGLVLLAGFVLVEARVAVRPMVPLRLLARRGVAVGNGMLLLLGGITIAMWYYTSLLLQNVLGHSAIGAGLGQTPAAVAFVVVARVAAGLLPRAGARRLAPAGGACFVAGFAWLAQAGVHTGYVTGVLGPTLLVATGIGLAFPTLMAVATAGVPESDAGVAGGLANTATQVGGSVGLAVLAATAAAATGGAARRAEALASGYGAVFLVAAGLGLAIAAAAVLLPRRR